ncbi:two-component system sensor histidine kinase MtrB [Microbacteriaceae bacterium SG_E_30_P1]|uniref:Sensor histidine kinase MtrB n=1 Tax=Antiquaquibacter oligotrophicus TaxID=2880260 RepID=A0ABT6KNR7_9MICO|nr:MtrAB system histidine kinase MtrB [Antiquaquibacter oligotrophicus]MDH6181649.1 two-component system sensor histidine kinase MtrB [Antiquaquibacter oligotrophicus]UDF12667.1 HAMP domain-containing histidine kinase [Antiquaquibacter oligotrophicus]
MRYLDWRGWFAWLARLWRSSLQVRTVAITVILSAVAVFIIGTTMSLSVGNNLFDARRAELEATSANATLTGQRVFDEAAEQVQSEDLEVTVIEASKAIASAASTPGGTQFAILRTPGQDGARAPADVQSRGLVDPAAVISPELRAAVQSSAEARTQSQSVALAAGDAVHPGLVVGSVLDIRGVQYELYLVYDIADAATTLGFVQQTLVVGGLSLIVLIAAVTVIVVRLVVGPVQLAAQTSERLAAGDLEVRIPEKGEDVIATLARSFNGMADSLQQQIERLAALSQVQQRFVSDVSHELRTPLTTIRLAGDVLYDQRETFPPTTARTAELLHTQVERFELLLADLLEMSRYDAGAVEMEAEPTNLVRLAEDAIDSVSALAVTKGSDLRLVAPGGYFEAEVDARRIRRILGNLLGNAIDHGEGKPIVIWVDSNAEAVAIAVRDYGIGMTPAAMDRVFDRFWRADPSRQRSTGGTGLGLAISLEDAALHGGWLEVWSAPGEGSCFRLTLPRERGGIITMSPLDLPPADDVPVAVDDA